MREVTLGLIQMRMGRDPNRNLDKAAVMIKEASRKGAEIVCLPELFGSPYFPQRAESDVRPEQVPNDTTERLSRIARDNRIVLVGGSVFEEAKGKTYNTSVVFDERGRLLGRYRKVHLPQDPGFYEQDYFSSGDTYKVFRTSFGRIGVLICFDQWYPEAARTNRMMGAQILFYPTAIGTVRGIEQSEGNWRGAWEGVQRGHAIANSMVVAAVNRVGREGEMNFWGGSFVCDQFGKVLARADSKERVIVATCDLNLGRDIEKGWGFMRNRKPATYQRLVK